MPLYFAYGSNMLRRRLERRIGRVEDFGWTTLHDHLHAFDKRGTDGTGKGNVNPRVRGVVHGVLYAISDRQLEALHPFEGGYRTMTIGIVQRSSGAELEAITYRAIRPAGQLTPSAEYLEYYRLGMIEHGLPEAYMRWILEHAG